jgi:hypothetical protein
MIFAYAEFNQQGDTNMRTTNKIILTYAMFIISSLVYAADSGWQGPPFSGTLQLYACADPAKKMSGKFYVNQDGSRSDLPSVSGRMLSITNIKAGKCWYADEQKKIIVEYQLNKKTGECPYYIPGASDDSENNSSTEAVPCEGYTQKKSQGKDTVAGRAVEKWACSGGDGKTSETQWFDPKLKFPLKSQTQEGYCMEYVEVKNTAFASSLLDMPKGYKKVSAEEFSKAMMASMMPQGMVPTDMPKQ